MSEYFLGLIVFAFVGAVIFSLVPEGASKRYVRLLCGLCSVGCIAFPVLSLISDGNDTFGEIAELFETSDISNNDSVEIYKHSLNMATLSNTQEELEGKIIQELSGKYGDVGVKIELGENGNEVYIKRIIVYIYSSGYALDPEKIKNVCQNELGKTCDIIYK